MSNDDYDRYTVNERWLLRNGSFAIITQRNKLVAVGHIEGSDQIHSWRHGKTAAGRGYDLVQKQPAPGRGDAK